MDPGDTRYPVWLRPTTSTRCTASWPTSVTSSRGRALLPLLPLVVVVAVVVRLAGLGRLQEQVHAVHRQVMVVVVG